MTQTADIKGIEAYDNLAALFADRAEALGDAPFLWAKRDGAYAATSWRATLDAVRRLAGGLKALGLARGDRVMLVSENRPEWLIADLAILFAGGVTVPAYVTNTRRDHLHVMNNAGATLVIVSTARLAKTVQQAADQADATPRLVVMEPFDAHQAYGEPPIAWNEVLTLGAEAAVPTLIRELTRDDLACLIYTSGTGGAPKGVMQTHGNLLHNCVGARGLLDSLGLDGRREAFLSFLPLSHAYEHTVGQMFPISIGAQIYYAEGLDKLASNLIEARPTIMTAVPRLYELLRGRILSGIERKGGLSETLFKAALRLGIKAYETPERLSPVDRLINRALDRLVRAKVAARFGGRLKAMVSGGGPLNYEVGLFFHALGVRILQGYGQTESAPAATCNPPGRVKMHTVGPPLADTRIKIAEDGEILIKGPLVMKGYWANPKATAQAIDDQGWLHSGDIGVIDHDNYLQITDRKKDIIVNSGGDNIAPQRVEGALTLRPEIAQAMVAGDRRPHLVGLIVPDPDWLDGWAAAHGRPADLAALRADKEFRHALAEAVDAVNAELSAIEKVRRFIVAAEPFSVENGEMTPTLKVRRHKVWDRYQAELEGLYGERGK